MLCILCYVLVLVLVVQTGLAGRHGSKKRGNKATTQSMPHPAPYIPLPQSVRVANFTREELDTAKKMSLETEIRMSGPEIALLMRYISKANFYFEFGCGGSTKLVSFYGPPEIYIHSLDSNRDWLLSVANSSFVRTKIEQKKISLQLINLGAIGDWGYPSVVIPQHHIFPPIKSGMNTGAVALPPVPQELRGVFATYPNAIRNITSTINVVLVDGRFRVACVINAVLAQPNAVILVHDFLEPGHHQFYNVLLDVMYIQESADTLVRLRRKADATDEILQAVLDKNIHIAW